MTIDFNDKYLDKKSTQDLLLKVHEMIENGTKLQEVNKYIMNYLYNNRMNILDQLPDESTTSGFFYIILSSTAAKILYEDLWPWKASNEYKINSRGKIVHIKIIYDVTLHKDYLTVSPYYKKPEDYYNHLINKLAQSLLISNELFFKYVEFAKLQNLQLPVYQKMIDSSLEHPLIRNLISLQSEPQISPMHYDSDTSKESAFISLMKYIDVKIQNIAKKFKK